MGRLSKAAKAVLLELNTAPGRVKKSRTVTALIKRGLVEASSPGPSWRDQFEPDRGAGRLSRVYFALTKHGRAIAEHLAGVRDRELDWQVPI